MSSRSDSKTVMGTRIQWLSIACGFRSQKNFAHTYFYVFNQFDDANLAQFGPIFGVTTMVASTFLRRLKLWLG